MLLDKQRTLKLTIYGMREYKKLTGKDILEFSLDDELKTESFEAVASVIWALCLPEDETLEYETVLKSINPFMMKDIIPEVTKALSGDENPLVTGGPGVNSTQT